MKWFLQRILQEIEKKKNNAWNIRRLVDESFVPVTQRTILKIVGFILNILICAFKKYCPQCVGVCTLTVHSHVSDSWPFDLATKQVSIKNSEFLGESKWGILKFQKGAFKNYVDMFFHVF